MRLFLAVLLKEDIKDELSNVTARLKEASLQGDFSPRENLHITLVFLGETNRLTDIRQVMDSITEQAFPIEIEKLGSFRRGGGDIFWAGVKCNPALKRIQTELSNGLREKGFIFDEREYRPHLTLGRRVVTKPDFDRKAFAQSMPEMKMQVGRVSLMKSERRSERMVYTEIYAKQLTLSTGG